MRVPGSRFSVATVPFSPVASSRVLPLPRPFPFRFPSLVSWRVLPGGTHCGLAPDTAGLQVRPVPRFVQHMLLTQKKQLVRISILQSSKIMTALYVLMGCIYTLVGIPMIIFGGKQIQIMGIIYLLMPIIMGIFGFIFFVIFA